MKVEKEDEIKRKEGRQAGGLKYRGSHNGTFFLAKNSSILDSLYPMVTWAINNLFFP